MAPLIRVSVDTPAAKRLPALGRSNRTAKAYQRIDVVYNKIGFVRNTCPVTSRTFNGCLVK